ncbi:uncharacterized protein BX663DRAFT_498631 [Cokeromyces recurvatus]|uniref:uncharacterized protein n=1 Tax=Cokeromyces recurvatus TaxID=90255 RepID=UPI0022200306|nr:uncharacterized protein BX663DRAFT_498631 [Cokeromyces recurvatus]KAI7906057.1 hypothetical protein BX663DRAFT_498631 [Cokeromyces recurvatus]
MPKRIKHTNKKAKLIHPFEPQKALSSNFHKNENKDDLEFEFELVDSTKKPLSIEQEEKLLQEDPISSFSQQSENNSIIDPWEKPFKQDNESPQQASSFELSQNCVDSQQEPSWSQVRSEFNDSQLSASLLFDLDGHIDEEKAESIISEFTSDNDTIMSFTEENVKPKETVITSDIDEEAVDELEEEYEFVIPTSKDISSYSHLASSSSLEFEFESPRNEPSSSQVISSLEFELEPHIEGTIRNSTRFKKGGLADTAMTHIIKEKKSFCEWEEKVNSQMAEYGSIVKVCQLHPESCLYRMIERWTEGGLIFAWCIPLKEEEIQYLLPEDGSSLSNTQNDSIKDFASQTTLSLPTYLSQSENEKELFAFSFAYVTGYVSVKKFIEKEQVVGIWPRWTKIDIETEKYGLCQANLAIRFKANSIY